MYSKKDNTSELYGIEAQLQDLRQGDMTVKKYFIQLTRAWQQLDAFEVYTWSCTTDAQRYKEINETKRVFRFFIGMNA